MTRDEILVLAQDAGITETQMRYVLMAYDQGMTDAVENRKKQTPLAWLVVDKMTKDLVKVSMVRPDKEWLAECYESYPLYGS